MKQGHMQEVRVALDDIAKARELNYNFFKDKNLPPIVGYFILTRLAEEVKEEYNLPDLIELELGALGSPDDLFGKE